MSEVKLKSFYFSKQNLISASIEDYKKRGKSLGFQVIETQEQIIFIFDNGLTEKEWEVFLSIIFAQAL